MNGTRDTVVQLVVQLWQGVLLVDGGLRQVSHGSSLNHVSDSDSLDGLVLWHTSSAVQTSDWLDVTSALLVSTVGSSLLWHLSVSKIVEILDGEETMALYHFRCSVFGLQDAYVAHISLAWSFIYCPFVISILNSLFYGRSKHTLCLVRKIGIIELENF